MNFFVLWKTPEGKTELVTAPLGECRSRTFVAL